MMTFVVWEAFTDICIDCTRLVIFAWRTLLMASLYDVSFRFPIKPSAEFDGTTCTMSCKHYRGNFVHTLYSYVMGLLHKLSGFDFKIA